ncbi:MAG TPA: LpxD N-terminal domain-containing protein, partial [Syntrophales bacterium]|nr:LpxD N-terminal domain-containing protein [Syntrophales bacterium]
MQKTLTELAAHLGGRIVGDAAVVITGVNSLEEAQTGELSFLANPKYQEKLATTRAGAILVKPGTEAAGK